GTVVNEDSNYDAKFWMPLGENAEARTIKVETKANPFKVPQFTVLLKQSLRHNGEVVKGDVSTEAAQLHEKLSVELNEGESYDLEKDVIVVTSRDVKPDDQDAKAAELMTKLQAKSFEENLADHEAVWQKRWDKSDVVIAGDDAAQQGIRFNICQLFMTYYGEDELLNVVPRGFTGENYSIATDLVTGAYSGPMYICVTDPSVARTVLHRRHEQSPGTYHNAIEQGV